MTSQNSLTGNERHRHGPQTSESSPLALIVSHLFVYLGHLFLVLLYYLCI